jgi:hypothetical protein
MTLFLTGFPPAVGHIFWQRTCPTRKASLSLNFVAGATTSARRDGLVGRGMIHAGKIEIGALAPTAARSRQPHALVNSLRLLGLLAPPRPYPQA